MNSQTNIICFNPNCDYAGTPKQEFFGSMYLCILLLFLGVIPGIFYRAFCMGTKYVCPKCGIVLDKDCA